MLWHYLSHTVAAVKVAGWALRWVPEPIRTGIEALYFQTPSVVQVGGSMSAAFDVNMGLKQSCPASLCVFCLFLDRVWDFITAHIPSSQRVHTLFLALLVTFILLYVHDLVLIAGSSEWLQ